MGRKLYTAQDTTQELLDEFDYALAHPTEIFGYARYGDGKRWVSLDKLTGGLQKRTMTVLASRPKRGKSMLAAAWVPTVAEQALAEDKVVRVITLEMSRASYQRRMAAILAGISDPTRIRQGLLTRPEQRRYREALEQLAALPIEYLANEKDLAEEETFKQGNSPITIADVNRFLRGGASGETYWWVLDHIGLVNDLNASGDMTTSIYQLANKLAGIAHSVASGLVITHLNRHSVGAMPTIESIAGSDQVGRNADQIMLLSRPFMDVEELAEEDRALIGEVEPAFLVFYSRDEGNGVLPLAWRVEYAAFEESPAMGPLPSALRNKRKRQG